MPAARSVVASPGSAAAKPSLCSDARHWRLDGLSGVLGAGMESDERFRLRLLGEDEGETEVSSLTPRFIDREMRPGDGVTTGAGRGLRR